MLGNAAEDIDQLISSRPKNTIDRIVIRSAGGHADVGLKVADIVRRDNMDVEVNNYCVSACASKIFAAGKRKILSPNSIVVFHPSATGTSKVLVDSGIGKAGMAFAPTAAGEHKLYRNLGINIDLLYHGVEAMIPVCVIEIFRKEKNDPFRYGVKWQYAGWVPSKQLLANAGMTNIEGKWPKNSSEAQGLAAQYFNSKFRLNYVTEKSSRPSGKQSTMRCRS